MTCMYLNDKMSEVFDILSCKKCVHSHTCLNVCGDKYNMPGENIPNPVCSYLKLHFIPPCLQHLKGRSTFLEIEEHSCYLFCFFVVFLALKQFVQWGTAICHSQKWSVEAILATIVPLEQCLIRSPLKALKSKFRSQQEIAALRNVRCVRW